MTDSQVFQIAPAVFKAGWLHLVIILSTVIIVAAVFGLYYTIWSTKNARLEVTDEGLKIHGGFYGRQIETKNLDLEKARAVDLGSEEGLRLSARRNGLGLPGLKGGWFKLNNGEKALVFLTDASRVAYVPTRLGYSLLFSLENPAALIQALRGQK